MNFQQKKKKVQKNRNRFVELQIYKNKNFCPQVLIEKKEGEYRYERLNCSPSIDFLF